MSTRDPLRLVLDALMTGVRAADPEEAVASALRVREGVIDVAGRVKIGGFEKIHVVGFGKASRRMLAGLMRVIGELVAGGVVIHPGPEDVVGGVRVLRGDHPIPGENTLRSSRELLRYVEERVGPRDAVFVLISGGGSALFEEPREGLSLSDIAAVSKMLMESGADIVELNTVRKHLSRVKGGWLAKRIRSMATVSLIISDVVRDPVEFIASGPTAPDPTTFADAHRVLVKRGVWEKCPAPVRELIERGVRGEAEETPKPGDPIFKKTHNVIVANNTKSLKAMKAFLEKHGYNVMLLTPYLEGEAREVGKALAGIAYSAAKIGIPREPPLAIVAGGETTVTVRGSGRGGRNQELCLSIAMGIRGAHGVYAGCMGSDGIDGNSPAAGALVDYRVVDEALEKGLDPAEYLDNNDSYTFFKKLGRTIETGLTGTNVNDLLVILVEKESHSSPRR